MKLSKELIKRKKEQDKAIEVARKILDEAGVKWIFATDEDVLDALDGDDRLADILAKGGSDLIDDINEECMNSLMNSWGDSLNYSIDSVLGSNEDEEEDSDSIDGDEEDEEE